MDMKQMMRQAQKMQAQLNQAQEEIKDLTYEASAGGGMVIHFSPSITVQGGGDVKGAVMEAAQLSMAELERLIRRLMDQQQRRSN